jgi:methylated-DNA-[protein]-cysteine S-methyltransferase
MHQKIFSTPIGNLLLKAEGGFVTHIGFSGEENVEAISSADLLLQKAEEQLHEYFEGKRRTFSFPFKQIGTAFQQQVWEKLITIGYGERVSYHELAVMLGNPKSIRAAAAANGKNHLAVVVPCHRIIGSNGSLTGFAWGLHRKKWLLDHEAKFSGKGFQPNLL